MDGLLQLLIVGGLFFLVMRFGCGSHKRGHGAKHGKGGSHGGGCCGGGHGAKAKREETDAAPPVRQNSAPPENDTDPVCGMDVKTATAKPSFHDGLVYYFCSQDCREAFEAAPGKYLDPETEAPRLET